MQGNHPRDYKEDEAVEDDSTDLKDIMKKAKQERENSAKVPELQVKSVQKEAEDGQVTVKKNQ